MSRDRSDCSVGARLRAIRKEQGLSQLAFAEVLGISLSAYQNYERGDRAITKDMIVDLKERYDIDPLWLLTGDRSTFAARQEPDYWRVYFGDDSAVREDLKVFGGRVRQAREDRGLSIEDVEAKTGVSGKMLAQIEDGERWPPSGRLDKLAGLLAEGGDLENLLHGLDWALVTPANRIKSFGILSALTFDRGGTAYVAFEIGDVVKILRAVAEVESRRPNSDPKIEEIVTYFKKRYWQADDDEYDDDIRGQLEFLAEVPIAAQGVKLSPIWPRHYLTEEKRREFAGKFEAQEPALHTVKHSDTVPILSDGDTKDQDNNCT